LRDARRGHPGQTPHAIEQLRVEASRSRVARVARARQRHPERRQMLGLEARAHGIQLLERAEEQAGARQRHERERDLTGDERTAYALTRTTGRPAAPA